MLCWWHQTLFVHLSPNLQHSPTHCPVFASRTSNPGSTVTFANSTVIKPHWHHPACLNVTSNSCHHCSHRVYIQHWLLVMCDTTVFIWCHVKFKLVSTTLIWYGTMNKNVMCLETFFKKWRGQRISWRLMQLSIVACMYFITYFRAIFIPVNEFP